MKTIERAALGAALFRCVGISIRQVSPYGYQSNSHGPRVCRNVVFGLHIRADHRGVCAAIDGARLSVSRLGSDRHRDCKGAWSKHEPHAAPMERCVDFRSLPKRALSWHELRRDADDPSLACRDHRIYHAAFGWARWLAFHGSKTTAFGCPVTYRWLYRRDDYQVGAADGRR